MVKSLGLLLILCGWLSAARVMAGGSWSSVNQYAPDQVWLMLLLSDGRILCENNPEGSDGANVGNTWFLLTPDNHGSYPNANWSYAQGANDTRQFFASQVLTDGNVFVAGGEYGSGYGTAELFNPLANGGSGSWSYINPPASLLNPLAPNLGFSFSGNNNQGFFDSISEILPNGNVLVAPDGPATNNGEYLIYNPGANSWNQAGPAATVSQDEASWVKLPDNSILTIDPYGTNTERYIPSANQWFQDSPVPVPMYDSEEELGPAFLLPNGKVFFLGATGHTVIYTPSPSGGTNWGSWVQGPDIPNGLVSADAPACMMANGKILCCVGGPLTGSGANGYPNGLSFYEYDYTVGPTGSFAQVNSPPESGNFDTYQTVMLALPDGTVLYSQVEQEQAFADDETTLYIYTPDGSPLAAGKPVIKSITLTSDGSYHLVGTGLNGISEGAAFGDDAQMNSNYPLVRFTDSNGNVTYARTYNWSSTGVQTGTNLVTTEFSLPASVPGGGSHSLVVVANGIASDPVTFDGPVWVDFNYSTNAPQIGTYLQPFSTLAQGTNAVASGGTISIKPGHSPETMTISKPMTITAFGGAATIGK